MPRRERTAQLVKDLRRKHRDRTASPRELPIVGGHLALDFANAVDDPLGPARHDHASTYDNIVRWSRRTGTLTDGHASGLLRLAETRTGDATTATERAHELRDTLNELFGGVADGTPDLSQHRMRLRPFVAAAFSNAALAGAGPGAHRRAWPQDDDLAVVPHRIARPRATCSSATTCATSSDARAAPGSPWTAPRTTAGAGATCTTAEGPRRSSATSRDAQQTGHGPASPPRTRSGAGARQASTRPGLRRTLAVTWLLLTHRRRIVTNQTRDLPDMLPVLSRGKHRNPRKGACFMELASFLAGERWSDHPACTHPLLAGLARHVNDLTSDAGRPRLAPLIPSIIGLNSGVMHVDARLALRAATTALPVVCEERQRVLALSLLASEEVLSTLEGRLQGTLEPSSREALDAAPGAEHWARAFRVKLTGDRPVSAEAFRRYTAPQAVRCATQGIAHACIPDPELLLYQLLAAAIDDCRRLVDLPTAPRGLAPAQWQAACQLVGVARSS